jgi:hypothetical protein
MSGVGHNQGPPLDGLSIAEAQELDTVQLRPSHVQRHAGPGSPLRRITHIAMHDWVLLDCEHWRYIRDFNIMPTMGRKRPSSARCGCCRLGYGT